MLFNVGIHGNKFYAIENIALLRQVMDITTVVTRVHCRQLVT
jgi:hypothetical protein